MPNPAAVLAAIAWLSVPAHQSVVAELVKHSGIICFSKQLFTNAQLLRCINVFAHTFSELLTPPTTPAHTRPSYSVLERLGILLHMIKCPPLALVFRKNYFVDHFRLESILPWVAVNRRAIKKAFVKTLRDHIDKNTTKRKYIPELGIKSNVNGHDDRWIL